MSLLESQKFFYDLCVRPEIIQKLKSDRLQVLRRYFTHKKDADFLGKVPLERYQTYRDHVAFGLLGGIASSFPVIRSLVSEKEWRDLLNDFYLKRLTRSPIARHIYREFAHYLQKKYRGPLLKHFPFLKELAHYENLDLEIYYAKDVKIPRLKTDLTVQTALKSTPFLNPHHSFRVYRWPVHRISRSFSSLKKVRLGRHALLVYRDPARSEVKFMELNLMAARLLTLLKKQEPVEKTLERLMIKDSETKAPLLIKEALMALADLQQKGMILGFQK